uniref:Secreted protein n=1 Tax=Parascaris univalens TaxID=6257 RepID=A0A915ACM2_PARUN
MSWLIFTVRAQRGNEVVEFAVARNGRSFIALSTLT